MVVVRSVIGHQFDQFLYWAPAKTLIVCLNRVIFVGARARSAVMLKFRVFSKFSFSICKLHYFQLLNTKALT